MLGLDNNSSPVKYMSAGAQIVDKNDHFKRVGQVALVILLTAMGVVAGGSVAIFAIGSSVVSATTLAIGLGSGGAVLLVSVIVVLVKNNNKQHIILHLDEPFTGNSGIPQISTFHANDMSLGNEHQHDEEPSYAQSTQENQVNDNQHEIDDADQVDDTQPENVAEELTSDVQSTQGNQVIGAQPENDDEDQVDGTQQANVAEEQVNDALQENLNEEAASDAQSTNVAEAAMSQSPTHSSEAIVPTQPANLSLSASLPTSTNKPPKVVKHNGFLFPKHSVFLPK